MYCVYFKVFYFFEGLGSKSDNTIQSENLTKLLQLEDVNMSSDQVIL